MRPGIGADPVDETTTADIPAPAPRAEETDPYEALGIRAGSFILYPSLTATTGYTTNASGSAGAAGSGFGLLEPELFIQSDWARHEATLSLRGSYEKFFDGSIARQADGGRGRYRAHRSSRTIGPPILPQAPDTISKAFPMPDFPAGADTPPGVIGLSSSAALNGNFGRGTFTIAGSVDRTMYENATSGGVPVDQGDRTNTVFGGRLRLGYEATASLTPFVEGEVSRRAFDRTVDNDGLQRSSTGLAVRAGVAFDRGPLLTGEIAVGTVAGRLRRSVAGVAERAVRRRVAGLVADRTDDRHFQRVDSGQSQHRSGVFRVRRL